MTHRFTARGFTLIELMIGIVIVGLLITMALPNFSAWIRNQQIRNGAEAILNGLQLARAQAIRSNANTEFALIDGAIPPNAGNVNAAASANGVNWVVRNFQNFQRTGVYEADDFVRGRSWQEGSKDQAVNIRVIAAQGSFVFTPLGRLLNPPANDIPINVDLPTAFANMRPMRVIVSTGGQILMCDPNRIDNTNPQFCPGP